jgi:hypothetical protein
VKGVYSSGGREIRFSAEENDDRTFSPVVEIVGGSPMQHGERYVSYADAVKRARELAVRDYPVGPGHQR